MSPPVATRTAIAFLRRPCALSHGSQGKFPWAFPLDRMGLALHCEGQAGDGGHRGPTTHGCRFFDLSTSLATLWVGPVLRLGEPRWRGAVVSCTST